MNIVQCRFCLKPFASVGGRVCPVCNEKIDKDFITVREYLYENKHSNIEVISEETEVSKQIIIHLLKEGRLVIDGPIEGGGILVCELCKKPVNTGRLCKDCMGEVALSLDKGVTSGKKTEVNNVENNLKNSAKINN